MVFDIKGKVCIVTGGASGIGLCYVRELLRNGAQAVTMADMNALQGEKMMKELNTEFGTNKVMFVKTDVTKADQFEAVFKMTMSTFKTIDIVINNAGVMNDNQWELQIAINCTAVVRGTMFAMQYMGKDKGGRGGIVVNIASILGLQELAGCPIYVGTKHFVIGFDRSMGTQFHFDRTGVEILTMCPGVTDTPLISEAGQRTMNINTTAQLLTKELAALPAQPPEHVGRCMMTMIMKGTNGSIWVCEGNQPIYEVHIPDRTTLKRM